MLTGPVALMFEMVINLFLNIDDGEKKKFRDLFLVCKYLNIQQWWCIYLSIYPSNNNII